jgi:hypothetical protein
MMKSFSEFLKEDKGRRGIAIAFGRFNPPTIGHEKLIEAVAKAGKGNSYRIYASQSQDSKKNPISHSDKVKYLRKMFPRHGRNIMADKDVRTILEVLSKLYSQGFTEVSLICGSDRISEFKILANKYNGIEGARHGFYNFSKITVISSGDRDPDSEGVDGMSASKMRAAASDNNFTEFSKGVPPSFKEAQSLFNAVRKGMGLKESYDFRAHVQLESVSEEREAYVAGKLFEAGESVMDRKTNEQWEIQYLGSNYVILEKDDQIARRWITDLEKIDAE